MPTPKFSKSPDLEPASVYAPTGQSRPSKKAADSGKPLSDDQRASSSDHVSDSAAVVALASPRRMPAATVAEVTPVSSTMPPLTMANRPQSLSSPKPVTPPRQPLALSVTVTAAPTGLLAESVALARGELVIFHEVSQIAVRSGKSSLT